MIPGIVAYLERRVYGFQFCYERLCLPSLYSDKWVVSERRFKPHTVNPRKASQTLSRPIAIRLVSSFELRRRRMNDRFRIFPSFSPCSFNALM